MPRRGIVAFLTGERGYEKATEHLLRTQDAFVCLLAVEFGLFLDVIRNGLQIFAAVFVVVEEGQNDALVSLQVFGSEWIGKKVRNQTLHVNLVY